MERSMFPISMDTIPRQAGTEIGRSPAFNAEEKRFLVVDGGLLERTGRALDNAFYFMEDAFGDSQEMVSFVTELNTNYYSIQFLKENDCDMYYKYNKRLLVDEQREKLLERMDEAEGMLRE